MMPPLADTRVEPPENTHLWAQQLHFTGTTHVSSRWQAICHLAVSSLFCLNGWFFFSLPWWTQGHVRGTQEIGNISRQPASGYLCQTWGKVPECYGKGLGLKWDNSVTFNNVTWPFAWSRFPNREIWKLAPKDSLESRVSPLCRVHQHLTCN